MKTRDETRTRARRTAPSPERLLAARGTAVRDLIRPGLKAVFCGINPGLYSAAVGHHFARPGNRFWTTLHGAGITPRLFSPYEDAALLELGYGIVNLVDFATASAAEIPAGELAGAGVRLRARIRRYRPRAVAVLGLGAYRAAFGNPRAGTGEQPGAVEGARLWVLPNPSGLNAHYRLRDFIEWFRALRVSVEQDLPRGS